MMHTIAAEARTREQQECAIRDIRNLQNKFPCGECKGHFGDYLQKHPPEEVLGKGEDSLFTWTVNFHNAVNYRLKKPQVSYEEAKSIFYDENVFCTAKCDTDDTEGVKETKKKKPTKAKLVPSDVPLYLR